MYYVRIMNYPIDSKSQIVKELETESYDEVTAAVSQAMADPNVCSITVEAPDGEVIFTHTVYRYDRG